MKMEFDAVKDSPEFGKLLGIGAVLGLLSNIPLVNIVVGLWTTGLQYDWLRRRARNDSAQVEVDDAGGKMGLGFNIAVASFVLMLPTLALSLIILISSIIFGGAFIGYFAAPESGMEQLPGAGPLVGLALAMLFLIAFSILNGIFADICVMHGIAGEDRIGSFLQPRSAWEHYQQNSSIFWNSWLRRLGISILGFFASMLLLVPLSFAGDGILSIIISYVIGSAEFVLMLIVGMVSILTFVPYIRSHSSFNQTPDAKGEDGLTGRMRNMLTPPEPPLPEPSIPSPSLPEPPLPAPPLPPEDEMEGPLL